MKLATPMSWTRIALCVTLAFAALPSHATILGVLGNNTYSIDETTAADVLLSTNVGAGSQATSMAKNSSGVIYIAGSTSTPTQLKTVDPVTGIISPGPTINLPADFSISIRGLAFNSADVLYAVNNGNVTNTPPYKLYTINPATGQGTFIGLVNGVVQALEFGVGDVLYGWEVGSGTGQGLVTINPATGAITDVNPAISGTSAEVQTLAISPGGTLYGANTSLYTVNVTTGALTLVAAMSPAISIQGMAFVTAGPPAPAVSLTPPSLAFGSVTVGSSSGAQTLTLQNVGTAVLNIASITASGDFAQTNACGSTLAATASCTISVTFTPTATGVRSGSVSVVSNAPGSPHSSSLGGTGTAIGPPPPPGTPVATVPTLSDFALLILMGAMAIFAMAFLRRPR
jgi:hypothetical protein